MRTIIRRSAAALKEFAMSEETVVEHCAPTLAGLKTGNLFACSFHDSAEMSAEIRKFNKILVPKGLSMIPLSFRNGRALIYLYRPDRLAHDLACADASSILREAGYTDGNIQKQLRRLMGRLDGNGSFPHEIGLFLSYPPEDVRGFIEQGPSKCKCSGIWKVYGDEQSARQIFTRYRRCHDVYVRQFRSGTDLSKLTVTNKKDV